MSGEMTELRLILAMAPSYQGGHSKIGAEVAAYLGVPFPLRLKSLEQKAKANGFDPYDIWPWLKVSRRGIKNAAPSDAKDLHDE